MPETEELVINTGPLLALIAGIGDLSLLELLYKRVLVTFEVCQEIEAGGTSGFGVSEFRKTSFIEKRSNPLTMTAGSDPGKFLPWSVFVFEGNVV